LIRRADGRNHRPPALERQHVPRPRDSRQAILDAATVEFAEHGFAGVSVDVIARRARVNKAMIYYHFGSKVRLYREILHQMFEAIFRRVQEIARSPHPPEEQIAAFIEAVVRFGEEHHEFPRMMAREMADRGRRLDAETIRLIARLPLAVVGIIEAGMAEGRFVEVDPFLTYFTLFGPMIIFLLSAPARRGFGDLKLVEPGRLETAAFTAHMQRLARRALLRDPAPAMAPPAPGALRGKREPRGARPGEHR
jgi:AcrR family transcriptional regulator